MMTSYRVLALTTLLLVAGLLPARALAQQDLRLQYYTPVDQRGVNTFEPTKQDTVVYEGFALDWGAAFTQQFQAIDHSNDPTGDATLELVELGPGFNLATANLYLGAQLAEGIHVSLNTYLSSRHHPEAWVKGGYVQADELPMFNSAAIDRIMDYVTIRLGHFEINYGDAHFRRTDNGNAIYNPFVGNYIMDSFTTEIGGEVYVRSNGLLGMVGITGGEINGRVTRPDDRAPSIYGKVGFDRQLNDDLRVRLTGSVYTTAKSLNNTLYSGDRAGSRYYSILETPTTGGGFTIPRVSPGFRSEVTAIQINPFVKLGGLEVFGLIETASGSAANEPENRTVNQFAGEVIYRFLPREQVYVGGRYNVASGEFLALGNDVSIDRIQIGGGWFATPNLLLKLEYVQQNYNDYPAGSLFHEAEFSGFMIEGVLAF